MKKRIYKIFLISVLGIFVITGCTWVGASDFLKDLNNDNKEIQDDLSQETGHADNGKNEEKDETDETDLNKDTEEIAADENNEDNEDADNNEEYNIDETEPEDKTTSDNVKTYYSGNGTKKLVALTFDDGPESKLTPQILDILDEYGIKATFFVVGQNAARNTDILRDIYDRGHEIGNHSWSHKYLPKISKKSKEDEILKTQKLLVDVLGEYIPIFRPPYGAVKAQDKQLINSLGYKVVNWSVDTRDWAGTSNEQIMKYVKQQLGPGGIILMHNSGNTGIIKNTVSTLPVMIEWIAEQGYEFVTVTEILD
ncbi:MAG TPA: polysaccharide deacetylase family protein [Oscillospiraceae bacterium]|nr:polysaccharide deacetylase family protein [Oscillospiraceae bacterium]